MEQFSYTLIPREHDSDPLRYALTVQPFLFLGYHFYNEAGVLGVHMDMARSMAQMRYPTLKWVAKREDLEPMELGRLAATLLGWGRPTAVLAPVFNALKSEILLRINRFLKKNKGDFENEMLRWAVSVNTTASIDEGSLSSLSGVARALSRSWDDNWLAAKEVSFSSADSEPELHRERPTDAALDAIEQKLGLLPKLKPATRRPSRRTDGRNPNTKVFAPALAPKPRPSRAHENQGYSRSQRYREATAEEWAANTVAMEQQASALVRSDPYAEEDMPADEMDDDGYGEELSGRELEEFLDVERWRIPQT